MPAFRGCANWARSNYAGPTTHLCFHAILLLECAAPWPCAAGVCYVRHEGCHWGTPGWRTGRTIVAADAGSREAGGAVRRAVSHHRHHAFRLHQFGFAARLRSDPVQSAELEPAHSRGLVAIGRALRLHRGIAAADARFAAVVSRHGGRG